MVDFGKENWYEDYCLYRKLNPVSLASWMQGWQPEKDRELYPQEKAYYVLARSGLLYNYPFGIESEAASEAFEKGADLITFNCLEAMSRAQVHALTEDSLGYLPALHLSQQQIKAYYLRYYKVFHREKPIEACLQQRFLLTVQGRRAQHYHNGLMLLDIVTKTEHLLRPETGIPFGEDADFRERQLRRERLTFQLLHRAVHCDKKVSDRERSFWLQCLEGSNLSPAERSKLDLDNPPEELDRMEILREPWLLRRLWLDICLFNLAADKEMKKEEDDFLDELVEILGLEKSDLEESQTLLGCFLLANLDKYDWFPHKQNFLRLLGNKIYESTKKLLIAGKDEGLQTKDMALTLGKWFGGKLGLARKEQLPDEKEIKEAMEQLKDIPRFAPFVGVAFLPIPGITEGYIFLALAVEKLAKGKVRILPTEISKMVQDH